MDCFTDFQQRGLVYDTTGEDEVRALLNEGSITAYAGFDPTADSLHIGNLVPLLGLARMQRWGHRPIVVAGGATGRIGDPSGKSNERNLLDEEKLERNLNRQRAQLASFLDFETGPNAAIMVDNHDWLGKFSFLEFLRDVGKYFSVNYMVAKDSVKSRMETGISFTEFSYMLLQGYDFLHLYREHGCVLQIGGSDQWGNITAGCELIRKVVSGKGHGMVFPLLTDSTGKKLGKSDLGENVWLDPEKTSPYQLYQYFVRIEDTDVIKVLRVLTFVELAEIDALAEAVEARPGAREAQKKLAWEMTSLVHGEEAARSAVACSKLLYGGSAEDLSERDLLAAVADVPHTEIPEAFGERDVVDLLASSGLVASRGQAKRLLQQGGVYVNNIRVQAGATALTGDRLLFGRYLLLRAGKRNYHLMTFG